ncbi:sensor histidine kinase [Dictyobacter kobayashii]|uniref:sensor histidine kinase n=1 Tax=Dictyobacter kobayashii TaxID=2014872 RepID=UPI001386D201|nr:PAS domain-containing sensor histidine kinase [Dictyobacter kobayashii]
MRTEQELRDELQMLRARVAELEQERDTALAYGQRQRIQFEGELESLRQTAVLDTSLPADEQVMALSAVFETIADGLVVYDRSGKIIRANQAFHQMMGIDPAVNYTELPMLERGVLLQLRDVQGEPLAEDDWPVRRILRGEVIAGGESADLTFVTLDGRTVQTDVSGAPIRDSCGEIIGGVIVFHDITARRRLEKRTNDVLQTLLEMAQVLVQGTDRVTTSELQEPSLLNSVLRRLMKLGRRVLRCSRVGVMLIDLESELLQSTAVIGASPEEMQHWQATLVDTRLSEHVSSEQLQVMQEQGQPIVFDIGQCTSAGRPRFYLLVPIIMHARIIGLMVLDGGQYCHELSSDELVLVQAISRLMALVLEREQLLEERAASQANELALMEANRRMDEFLSIASHELRTPMTTINGNIQLAKRRVSTLALPDEVALEYQDRLNLIVELLNRAERQVRIQNRLVGDLLDVSRIQTNRLELNMDDYDLVAITREAVEDQRMAAPGRVILLRNDSGQEALTIFADADRIGQVVTNFLTNALKYSAGDRPVEARIELINHAAKVSVLDEGPGLPPEEKARLWERFYRVAGIVVQSGSGVGLGLGLYICRTIIERHGGQVGVDSEVGKGSSFWFMLPLASTASEEA